ncbi:MAG TPA: CAP domain-containing protein [Longimicrobiales bacterium]
MPAEPPDVAIEHFVALAQDARRQAGCPPLVWDTRAAAVARAHSRDMLRRGYFSHETPEGRSAFDRMRAAGIRYSAAAENIAYGARTGAQVYNQWIGSRGHRRNLLNCRYTRHGIGLAGDLWTHVLYAP